MAVIAESGHLPNERLNNRALLVGPEVSVPAGCPGGVEVGWWDEPGDAGPHLDGPVFFVDHVVVMGAEQGSVVGSGGAAAGPVGDVVGLAPGGGDGALREGAALVPGGDGLADVGREDAGGASDVQDLALAAEDDRDDVGVAGDFADGAGGDGAGEHQRARLLQRPCALQGPGSEARGACCGAGGVLEPG